MKRKPIPVYCGWLVLYLGHTCRAAVLCYSIYSYLLLGMGFGSLPGWISCSSLSTYSCWCDELFGHSQVPRRSKWASYSFCQSLEYPPQANCSLKIVLLSLDNLKFLWLQIWVSVKLCMQFLNLKLFLNLYFPKRAQSHESACRLECLQSTSRCQLLHLPCFSIAQYSGWCRSCPVNLKSLARQQKCHAVNSLPGICYASSAFLISFEIW